MTIYERLFVNGQDLNNYCSCIESLNSIYLPGTTRGENLVVPGMDGEIWVEKPFEAQTIDLGLTLHGRTTAQFNTSLRTLTRLLQPGKRLELERQISYTTGNERHVAGGEFVAGLRPNLRLMRFGKVTLTLRLFDGKWYDSVVRGINQNVANGQSVDVVGDLPTYNLTIRMSPGAWIINQTNGNRLSNTAPNGGTVIVDSTKMSATQDGSDVSYSLEWTHRHPMRLEPGLNQFATSGTSFQVNYRAAYL